MKHKKLVKDITFLQQMKALHEESQKDYTKHEYLGNMISDWLKELETRYNNLK